MPEITTKRIADLTGTFVIPLYQRGYRWQEIQVQQLLDDLWDFYQEHKNHDESWYCLQPLVVAGNSATTPQETPSAATPCGLPLKSSSENGGKWTVLDGQQRLTTLFIILQQLDGRTDWTFEYKRPGRKNFPTDTESTNPDCYFGKIAKATVASRLKDITPDEKSKFAECIRNNTRFIWYETIDENHYEVFTRINSGKIALSNAELVKALLLRETRFQEKTGTVKLQQLEIAGEWDRIEQALGDDEFWYFINSAPQSERFNATRIDFLFELVLRKGIKEDIEKGIKGLSSAKNYPDEIKKNHYFGFKTFMDYCNYKIESEKIIWSEIQSIFRRIKSWYDDRKLYHYVGFLMNRKGEDTEKRFETLITLLKESTGETKAEFLEHLKIECRNTIKAKKLKLDELVYNEHNNQLNDALLLFNLALLDRQSSEQSRYPFKTHTGTAWSLEHIHAKNERELDNSDVNDLMKELNVGNMEALNTKIKEKYGDAVKLTHPKTEDGNEVQTKWCLECEGQETHGLENLALLERKQNSTFNNKLYPEKKDILSQWEKGEASGELKLDKFIPLGTKIVFFKHFSPVNSCPFVWDTNDGDAYFETIVKTIADYVGMKECDLRNTAKINNGGSRD